MFGKIKNKLKSVFEKQEEVIEEVDDNLVDEKLGDNLDEIKEENLDGENNNVEETLDKRDGIEEDFNFGDKIEEEILEDEIEQDLENEKELEIVEEENIGNEIDNKKGFFSKFFKKKKEEEGEDEIKDELKNELGDEILEKEEYDGKKEILDKNVDKKEEQDLKNEVEQIQEKEDIENSNNEKSEGILSKTFSKLKSKKITEDDFDKIWVELEIFLLEINVAFEIVEKIQEKLKEELVGNSFDRFKLNSKIREVLEKEVEDVLVLREGDLINKIKKIREDGDVARILILGVNGTGKTTSIAKFVNYLQKENLKVVVAAADTFRAAAIEQLDEHAKKLNFKLIKHQNGSDPAAVAFDAIEHARAKNLGVVLIDTAGRMPNNSNLMAELQKINKVSKAQLSIFIGDSISGNDLIDQINLFDKGVKIDGVILTKVDTDERPGSIVTTAYAIDKPIYFLGVGQGYDDLIKFDAKKIAKELFNVDDE